MSGRRELKTEELNRISGGGGPKDATQKDVIYKDSLSCGIFNYVEKENVIEGDIKKDDINMGTLNLQEKDKLPARMGNLNSLDNYLKPEEKNSIFGGLIALFKKIFGGN